MANANSLDSTDLAKSKSQLGETLKGDFLSPGDSSHTVAVWDETCLLGASTYFFNLKKQGNIALINHFSIRQWPNYSFETMHDLDEGFQQLSHARLHGNACVMLNCPALHDYKEVSTISFRKWTLFKDSACFSYPLGRNVSRWLPTKVAEPTWAVITEGVLRNQVRNQS